MDVDTVNSVTLEDAKKAIMSQLVPKDLEIVVAGDFETQEVLDMILKYIGTIPADANSEYIVEGQTTDGVKEFGSVPDLELPGRFLQLELPDSDP